MYGFWRGFVEGVVNAYLDCGRFEAGLVGAHSEIFSKAVLLAIVKTTGGACRTINNLCCAALTLGAVEQKDILSEEESYRASAEI